MSKRATQIHDGKADKPSPSEYTVQVHQGAKPGEWQGAYVPSRGAAHKKAAASKLTASLAAAAAPRRPVDAAKIVREMRGR